MGYNGSEIENFMDPKLVKTLSLLSHFISCSLSLSLCLCLSPTTANLHIGRNVQKYVGNQTSNLTVDGIYDMSMSTRLMYLKSGIQASSSVRHYHPPVDVGGAQSSKLLSARNLDCDRKAM